MLLWSLCSQVIGSLACCTTQHTTNLVLAELCFTQTQSLCMQLTIFSYLTSHTQTHTHSFSLDHITLMCDISELIVWAPPLFLCFSPIKEAGGDPLSCTWVQPFSLTSCAPVWSGIFVCSLSVSLLCGVLLNLHNVYLILEINVCQTLSCYGNFGCTYWVNY